jgi:hypothetical protein
MANILLGVCTADYDSKTTKCLFFIYSFYGSEHEWYTNEERRTVTSSLNENPRSAGKTGGGGALLLGRYFRDDVNGFSSTICWLLVLTFFTISADCRLTVSNRHSIWVQRPNSLNAKSCRHLSIEISTARCTLSPVSMRFSLNYPHFWQIWYK